VREPRGGRAGGGAAGAGGGVAGGRRGGRSGRAEGAGGGAGGAGRVLRGGPYRRFNRRYVSAHHGPQRTHPTAGSSGGNSLPPDEPAAG